VSDTTTAPTKKPVPPSVAAEGPQTDAVPARLPGAAGLEAIGWPLLALAILLGFWELASALGMVDPLILPPPSEIGPALVDLVQQGFFWEATWVTVQETLLGFALGVAGAWVLGTAIGLSRVTRLAIYPLVVAFQITPRIALAPLFIAWLGFGMSGKVMMAATLCFFPVLINVIVGIDGVDDDARKVLRSYGASRWDTYRKLTMPSSLPVILAGVKTAVTLALIGAIVGEFVGGSEGLGVVLKDFYFQLEVASGFAIIIALAVIGLAVYGAVELVERRLVFWRGH
jgi:NitT/TauT family transport system permease protein